MSATGEIVAVRPKGSHSLPCTSLPVPPRATCAQWLAKQAASQCQSVARAACLTTKLIALHAHATGHSCHSRLASPLLASSSLAPSPLPCHTATSRGPRRVCAISSFRVNLLQLAPHSGTKAVRKNAKPVAARRVTSCHSRFVTITLLLNKKTYEEKG